MNDTVKPTDRRGGGYRNRPENNFPNRPQRPERNDQPQQNQRPQWQNSQRPERNERPQQNQRPQWQNNRRTGRNYPTNNQRTDYRRNDDYNQRFPDIRGGGGRGRFGMRYKPEYFDRGGQRYNFYRPRFKDYLHWLGDRGRGFHNRIAQYCDVNRGFFQFNNRFYGVGFNNQWYPINTGFCRGLDGNSIPYFADSGFYVDDQGIVYADGPQGLIEVATGHDQYGYFTYGPNGEQIRIQPQPLNQGDYNYNQPNYLGGGYTNSNININGGVTWGNGNWGVFGGYNQGYRY